MSDRRTAVVVAAGSSSTQVLPPGLDPSWPVVAADSGLDLAERLGLEVGRLVGDLDSASFAALDRARKSGVEIEAFPADKDQTDLELAIASARRLDGIERLVVLGGDGGRLDHLLGNVALLAGPATDGVEVEAWLGEDHVAVVRGSAERAGTVELRGAVGSIVSLLAWHGPATGVTTGGLRWPLSDAVLEPGSSWGTSNETVAPVATVTVRSGVLTAVRPGAATTTEVAR